MNQLRFEPIQQLKMTAWIIVLWKICILQGKLVYCNGKKWLEMIVKRPLILGHNNTLRFSLSKNVIRIQSYPCQALLPCCTRIQKTHKILNFPLVRVAFAFRDLDIPDPLKNSFQNRVLCQLWIRSKSCNISPIHLKFKKNIYQVLA